MEALGDLRVEHLCDGVDHVHVLHGDHDRLPDILIPFDMGGDADLVDDGGHQLLQAGGMELAAALLRQADQVLHQSVLVIGLADEDGGAQLARLGHHVVGGKVGDGQYKRAALPVQTAQNAKAIQTGQDQIQHQKIRFGLLYQPQGLLPVAGGGRHEKTARPLQGVLQHAARFLVGVRQHDLYSVVHMRVSFPKFACRHE